MIGRYLNMECVVEWFCDENLMETIPIADYDRTKRVRECGIFIDTFFCHVLIFTELYFSNFRPLSCFSMMIPEAV